MSCVSPVEKDLEMLGIEDSVSAVSVCLQPGWPTVSWVASREV